QRGRQEARQEARAGHGLLLVLRVWTATRSVRVQRCNPRGRRLLTAPRPASRDRMVAAPWDPWPAPSRGAPDPPPRRRQNVAAPGVSSAMTTLRHLPTLRARAAAGRPPGRAARRRARRHLPARRWGHAAPRGPG